MARPKAMSNPAQVGQSPTAPRAAAQRSRAPTLPRRMFNCIVDDTVLIAGVKTNLLKKWVTRGDVRIFVPLSTLEKLQVLSHGQDMRANADARSAMKWLDEVTNQTNSAVGNRVRIEGSLEKYEAWSDVSALMLPNDFVSTENNEHTEAETDEEELLTKNISDLLVDDEPDVDVPQPQSTPDRHIVEPTSPVSAYSKYSPSLLSSSPCFEPTKPQPPPQSQPQPQPQSQPSTKMLAPIGSGRPMHRKTDSNASSILTTSTARPVSRHNEEDEVPSDLKPFFNHIMWRIKKDPTTDMGVDSYILLTNDLAKQAVAQRFGIRVKRLDQMRETVMREDQDLKNRIAMQKREAAQIVSVHKPSTLGFSNGSPVIPDAPSSPTIQGETPNTTPATPKSQAHEDEAEEDVILIKPKTPTTGPPKGPQAMQPQKGPKSQGGRPVFDPNSFQRGGPAVTGSNGSVRGNNRSRGHHTQYGSTRGNGANGSANGSNRYSERPPSRGVYSARRGQQSPQQPQGQEPQQPLDLSRPIDPNVFSRGGPAGVKEKVRRQLWEP